MDFSAKKIITAVAWGLAFSSACEMVLAMAFGARAGVRFGKGHDFDEVAAAVTKEFSTPQKVVPPVAGVVGLSLGLLGLLPGTEGK